MQQPAEPERPELLLVDDDVNLCAALSPALARRGFQVRVAHDTESAIYLIDEYRPAYAVIDLKLGVASGLPLVSRLRRKQEDALIVVLTGFGSIATAVQAIKLGATYYLTKPANVDDILSAFKREQGHRAAGAVETPLSANRLEWEHIQRVLIEHDGNISATARALNMHRRTLQRKLGKHPARR